MLKQLRIVDFAIIDEAELALGPRFNVLTGETGAGKSMIVGAAALLRGGRASAELVRKGRKEATVEAVFQGTDELAGQLEQSGIPVDGGEVLVRRIVSRAGRGRVYVNGALCTVSLLARLSGRLLDISGQHEHQLLSDAAMHRRLLDALGTPAELLEQLERAFRELRDLAERLERGQGDERQRAERVEFLRYQLSELERAGLRAGEQQELEQEQRRLERAAELLQLAHEGEQQLYGGDGAVAARLARLRSRLDGLAAVDPGLAGWSAQLEEARLLVEDVGQGLGRYSASVELDPARLSQVEERMDLLHRLCRKHGCVTADELLARQEQMQTELEELGSHEERTDALERQLAELRRRAEQLAGELSVARREAADRLGRQVSRELRNLRMPGARMEVALSELPAREGDPPALCFGRRRLGAAGWDRVEFCIRTNVGEAALALGRVASGGELSRIMLALRKVLGVHDPVGTSIYDEVDAGVGGAVADVVGRSLAEVARHRQVLCVTHLPQVAAYAGTHFSVGKRTRGRRTVTSVRALTRAERVEELARMLGGEEVGAGARANARQLLKAAGARG